MTKPNTQPCKSMPDLTTIVEIDYTGVVKAVTNAMKPPETICAACGLALREPVSYYLAELVFGKPVNVCRDCHTKITRTGECGYQATPTSTYLYPYSDE
jgi:hypothetical protein